MSRAIWTTFTECHIKLPCQSKARRIYLMPLSKSEPLTSCCFAFLGMQVLEWNGIPLTGKTYEEVQNIIIQQSGEAEICVRL